MSLQNINFSPLRLDYSRSDKYIYPDPPQLTFMQKLGRGLGKFVSWAGPIGAAVTAIALPGIGLPIAGGIYGLTKVARDQLAKSQTRDQIAMANQQGTAVTLPGLFETSFQAGDEATSFMAPSSFHSDISQVVIERSSAHQEAIQSM